MQWTVSWQDFRRHEFGDPKPIVQRDTFDTREAADWRKTELQSCGVVACVTPLAVRRRRQKPRLDGEAPRFNENWTLAK
jgi:hypothetical protein